MFVPVRQWASQHDVNAQAIEMLEGGKDRAGSGPLATILWYLPCEGRMIVWKRWMASWRTIERSAEIDAPDLLEAMR